LTELKLRMQHPETANAARWKSGLQGPRGFFHPTGALAPEVPSHFDHDHSEDRRRIPIPWQLLIRITRTAFSEMLLTIPSTCPGCRMSAPSARKDLCQQPSALALGKVGAVCKSGRTTERPPQK